MKRVISIIVIVVCAASMSTAQQRVIPNKPFVTLYSNPGFVTINEVTGGIGLAGTYGPFSKWFGGLTSVWGYQLNRNLIFGAGTGLYYFESGMLVPLFLDFRFAFDISKFTPYFFADGGLFLNISNFKNTNLFINPGVGARLALRYNMALNLGAGLLTRADGTIRESFINMKFGVIYMF